MHSCCAHPAPPGRAACAAISRPARRDQAGPPASRFPGSTGVGSISKPFECQLWFLVIEHCDC